MKLDTVVLCLDCDEVYDVRSGSCPACGTGHFFPIVKWLNKDEGIHPAESAGGVTMKPWLSARRAGFSSARKASIRSAAKC